MAQRALIELKSSQIYCTLQLFTIHTTQTKADNTCNKHKEYNKGRTLYNVTFPETSTCMDVQVKQMQLDRLSLSNKYPPLRPYINNIKYVT